MLTYGLLFIVVNTLYFLFAVFVGVSLYFLLRKKWWIDELDFLKPLMKYKRVISITAFLVILLLPFYDLLIQKGIKTYYQTFKMDDTIYSYPEKDKDGKIESLNNTYAVKYLDGYLLDEYSHKRLLKSFNKIEKFVEIRVLLISDENGKYIGERGEKLIKIDLNKREKPYMNIPKNDFKARYIVDATNLEPNLFNIYQKKVFTFKDSRKDIVMATAWRIEFPTDKNSFRSRYLLWRSANGVPMGLDFISNDKRISEKIFGFDYRINVSKLRG
jgi:amino acid transporter